MGFTLAEQEGMAAPMAEALLAIGQTKEKREWKFRENLLDLLAGERK